MAFIRTFAAITVPPSVKKAVEQIQDRFKQTRAPIKWVNPANLHLTLKFLGNVPEEQVGEIKERLADAGKGISSFILKATEIGVFPNEKRPRVLWLGFSEASEQIQKLVGNIEHQLQKSGFKPGGRKFTPHLTIGRIRPHGKKSSISQIIQNEKNVSCDSIGVKCFHLIKSDLKPSGSVYTVLNTFDLKQK